MNTTSKDKGQTTAAPKPAPQPTPKPPVDIVLTTWPEHKSQNVGDSYITNSAIALTRRANPDYSPEVVFREKPLDGYSRLRTRSVMAPGMSVAEGTYPKLYKLYEDRARLKNFRPVGCSYQAPLISRDAFVERPYETDSLNFLKFLNDTSGPLPCRDQLITDRLAHHGISSVYSSDLVFFDDDIVNTPFAPPHEITSIVCTVQHHLHYLEQSLELFRRVAERFPQARRYVSLHSRPGYAAKTIAARCAQFGFEVLDLYGPSENLAVYSGIDLHVGYRLHGHISFLRARKPSILMVEDIRAFGLSRTSGTQTGCVDAFASEGEHILATTPRRDAPEEAMALLEHHLRTDFADYEGLFDFIDETYDGFVRPFFDDFAQLASGSVG